MKKRKNLRQRVIINSIAIAYCMLSGSINIAAAKDAKQASLLVYLSESDSVFCVNLVFENQSEDTMIVADIFENRTRDVSFMRAGNNIFILTYHNHDLFKWDAYWVEKELRLSGKRHFFVPPRSKTQFSINVKDYFGNLKDGELGIRFLIDYFHIRYDKNPNTKPKNESIKTNYAKVKSKPSPLDRRHELLFDCVYQHNNLSNREYKRTMPFVYNRDTTIAVGYTATEENEWINQWRISSWNELKIAENITKKIRDTKIGRRIPNIVLTAKNIYTGTFVHNGVYYPAAFYSEKDTIKEVLKIQVSDIDRLDKKWNRRYINCDDSYTNYIVIAFYEEGATAPALMLQVEKVKNSGQDKTKEDWLKILNILVEKQDNKLDEQGNAK